jgi:hypothetical protein
VSIFKKTFDLTRFSIESDGPGWQDKVRAGLQEWHFRENPPAGRLPRENDGWVRIDNLSSVEFQDSTAWSVDGLVFFGWRMDRRSIPGDLFKAELAKRIQAWKTEKEVEHVPAAVRREFKEILEDEWCRRMLPKVKVVKLVVEPSSGQAVAFGGLGASDLDGLRVRFYKSFGVKLIPLSLDPTPLLGAQLLDELKAMTPLPLVPGVGARNSFAMGVPAFLMDEFYLWLWMVSENGDDIEGLELDLCVDKRLKMQSTESTASFKADGSFGNDAREALRTGKVLTGLSLDVRERRDSALEFGYQLSTDLFKLKLTPPPIDYEDSQVASEIWGMWHAVLASNGHLDGLFRAFLQERSDPSALLERMLGFVNEVVKPAQEE